MFYHLLILSWTYLTWDSCFELWPAIKHEKGNKRMDILL